MKNIEKIDVILDLIELRNKAEESARIGKEAERYVLTNQHYVILQSIISILMDKYDIRGRDLEERYREKFLSQLK